MSNETGFKIFASIVIIAVFAAVMLAILGIDPSGYIDIIPAIVVIAFLIGVIVTIGKTASDMGR